MKIDLEKEVKIDYCQGVEGNSIYINEHRVAGNKPWGGGKILYKWKTTLEHVLEAFPEILSLVKEKNEM